MKANIDDNLLSMDPDKIFELNSIDQVKDLVRSLQRESDRKREELRSLVGERYRDLMEAAETIICMRDTSSNVANNLEATQDSMSSLSDQLQSFRLKFEADSKAENDLFSREDEHQYALAAQIKLLMDIPERIWTAIESGDNVTAAKLYLFARHIHTNVTFQEDNHLAVIERQWAAISQFHELIKNSSEDKLNNTFSSLEESLDAMISVMLLKSVGQSAIFEEFLKRRQKELSVQLKKHDISAKKHITDSLSSIAGVLVIVHEAFVKRQLDHRMNEIHEEKTVQLLNVTVESPVMEFLPSIVRDFKIISEDANDNLETEAVTNQCAKWLDDIHEVLTDEASLILSHVHNIGGLSHIRKSVLSFMSTSSVMSLLTPDTCRQLLGHDINLWQEFYRNQFRDRIEAIIKTHFAGTSYFLQSSLSELPKLEQELVIDIMMSEMSLNQGCSKAIVYSPIVKNMCLQFNELLDAIIKDINDYLDNDDDNDNFILNSVQKWVIHNMEEFIGYVDKHQVSAIGTGRLLQAIPDLCPSLRTCSLAPKLLKINKDLGDFSFNKSSLSSKNNEPEWQALRTKLENKANDLFKTWIKSVTSRFEADLKSKLVNNAKTNLNMMLNWDSIEISEQGDEEGQVVKSKIRVPQHLSLPAFESMMNFCSACHQIGVHSLPMTIQNELSQSAAMTMSNIYNEFCVQNSKLTQNVALQLHFDVQFIMQVMISHNNIKITDQCQQVLNTLENHIDPFDFSVFNPFIESHVKRCVLRHQNLFSVMIPNDKFALMASLKSSIPSQPSKTMTNGHHHPEQNEHNVMIMVPNCSRFALLPVMANTSHSSRGREAKTLTASNLPSMIQGSSSSPGRIKERKRSKSPVARAANSFFEAMSNSWFGTK